MISRTILVAIGFISVLGFAAAGKQLLSLLTHLSPAQLAAKLVS